MTTEKQPDVSNTLDAIAAANRASYPKLHDVTSFGEHTLEHVADALLEAVPDLTPQQVIDFISSAQNRGIFFREQAEDVGEASDGYHTFNELYDHRRALTAVLASIGAISGDAWRSKQHHPEDDPMFDGYFIVGIVLPDGPVSYHYELKYWDDFAAVAELEYPPKWDGHDSAMVVERLFGLVRTLHGAIEADGQDEATA